MSNNRPTSNSATTTTKPLVSSSSTNPIVTNGITTTNSKLNTPNVNASNSTNPNNDINPSDIGSPHELIGWVDNVLVKLENKFDRIEQDVLERLEILGKRIDSLENSMSGLLDGASVSNPGSAADTPVKTNGP